MKSKESIRSESIRAVLGFSKEKFKTKSNRIKSTLSEFLSNLSPKSVMGYLPLPYEPNLFPELFSLKGFEWCAPRVSGEDIIPIRVNGKTEFVPGRFGILEPLGDVACSPDCAVVPGIAFGRNRYRIGHGKAYYDRFFIKNPGIFKIGVCFSETLYDFVPFYEHDAKMDLIITDSEVVR